jgi:8-oxo-dGTP pyrophosphatase MutT (NUDIX family)
MRRAGTGYHDGDLDLPSGHLDGNEDAVRGLQRELFEELVVLADVASCRLALVMHRAPEFAHDDEYLDLVFTVGRWTGIPQIGEPDQCSELMWAESGALSADVVPYVRDALDAVAVGQPLLLYGWDGPLR